MQVGQAISVVGTLATIAQGGYQIVNGDLSGAAWTFTEAIALNGVAFWGRAGINHSVRFIRWWSGARKVRLIYNASVQEMRVAEASLRAAKVPLKQIAEKIVELRNRAKVSARALMDAKDVAVLEARNLEKYGDPVGPGVDWLVAKILRESPGTTEAQALEMVIEGAFDTSRWFNALFLVF